MDEQNLDPNADPQETQTHEPDPEDSGNPAYTGNAADKGSSAASGKVPQTNAGAGDPDLEILQQELNDARQKLEEMTGISKRALADLQNYRRRVEEEKSAFIDFANASLFTELLPAIENIKRTIDHDAKDEEWIKGATATMGQILAMCEKHGLKAIPVKPGDQFDPNIHEALLTAPGPKDEILEVLENGYMLGERMLKQSRVKVGNGE